MATKADGTIIIDTRIDTDGINKGVNEAKKALDLGDVIKGSAIGSAISSLVTTIVANVKEIGQAFIESAATVKAQGSQFEQTFKDMQDAAHTAINGVAKDSGILETRLETLGSQIYAFARSSGGDANESLELMEKSLQAAADGAAYYDRSLEDTTASLQSLLKGNFENDAALGLSATEATRNAEAYELFGKKFNDLTEIQKQQTLLQMVLDAQELSGAMGQAARESEGWENVQGNLNESIRQFQAAAGEPFLAALVPTVQKLTNGISNLTKNADWDGFSKGIKTLVSAFEEGGLTSFMDTATQMGVDFVNNMANGLASNVTMLIETGISMVMDFSKSLITNATSLAEAGINFVSQIAEGFANGLPAFFQSIPGMMVELLNAATSIGISFIDNLSSGIAGNVKVLLDNALPAILSFTESLRENAGKLIDAGLEFVLQISKGFADSLPTFFQTVPEMVSNLAGLINDNAPKLLVSAGKLVLTLLEGLWNSIPDILDAIPDMIQAMVDVFMAYNWIDLGKNIITFLKDGITSMISAVKTSATSVKDNIANVISQLPAKLKTLGTDGINSLINAIKGLLSSVKTTAGNVLTNIVNGVKDLPTKLVKLAKDSVTKMKDNFKNGKWKDLGKNIIDGIISGISGAANKLLNKLRDLAKSALNAAKKALGINSPSRVFRDVVGKMIPAGITEGLDAEFPDTIKSLRNHAEALVDAAGQYIPNVMELATPVMATGTILPANAGFNVQSHQLDAIASKLAELAARTGSMEHVINNNATYQFTAQLNRRTLFEEFMEEAKMRSMQTGRNVFEF